jgi:hypothetical protein
MSSADGARGFSFHGVNRLDALPGAIRSAVIAMLDA